MKKILHTLICIMSINMANAQNVNIPDSNFKAALVNNAAINTSGDGEIQVTEAVAFTGQINVSNMGIGDLTGIEAFTALDSLKCSGNQLASLNVSANTALTYLNCGTNQLASLNVSANTALTYLNCTGNQLTSLNVSANTALNELPCYNNQLTSLDVSANTVLTYLDCSHNQLTSLVVSTNTALTLLLCGNNQLMSLDVSANTALTRLYCDYNQLTSLNVSAHTDLTLLRCNDNPLASLNVSANTALYYLYCQYNQLTSLDVSADTALTYLDCSRNQLTSLNVSANTALTDLLCDSNQLTSLNVQNGNNVNFYAFDAINNPNLTCIQVDSVTYSNANWSAGKDSTASFSTNCATGINDVSTLLNTISLYPNPTTNQLTIALESNNQKFDVTITDITGKIIYSTTASDSYRDQKIEVNTEDFRAGVYVVQIQTPDFIATKRLVVEK